MSCFRPRGPSGARTRAPPPPTPHPPYLLKHLFGGIEFHLVSFQTHFQVPNLLSLGFHLVCEDTHLSQEIKQWWRRRDGSLGAVKPRCRSLRKDGFPFWQVAGAGRGWGVGGGKRGSRMQKTPAAVLPRPCLPDVAAFPCSCRIGGRTRSGHERCLGLGPAPESSHRAHAQSGPPGVSRLACQGSCHLTSCARAIPTPRETNQ